MLFLKNVEGEMNLSFFIKNETYANNYGGAAKLINSSPLFTECLFSKNKSWSNSAGAIYIDENSAPKLSSNEFNENYAKSWGGAIYSESADLNVSGGSFYGNWASYGGAVATNGTQLTSFNSVKAFGNEANATSGSQGVFFIWEWSTSKYLYQLSFPVTGPITGTACWRVLVHPSFYIVHSLKMS